MTVTAGTRVLALLGDPISHSASPELQNAAFRKARVKGVYVAVRCAAEDLGGLMRGLARAGGGGNVTLPHKEAASRILDIRSEAVRRTGACNTFWGDDAGRLHGDNTDVEGVRRALASFMHGPAKGMRVLLLGAGGAARASLAALVEEDAGDILLFNRTLERARAVSRRIGGKKVRVIRLAKELEGQKFDLVVNATCLGLKPDDPSPFDLNALGRVGQAMDLVYGKHIPAFVQAAEEAGIRATDGAEVLVQQAAVSFERWWGREAPLDAMRKAMGKRYRTR
ncbi:MAG TPA: shikimate dehydrogenase [Gemmatimonadetes bacterium]|nr:shikimate dehydrogenase [Gemmatimonadota bacterium]